MQKNFEQKIAILNQIFSKNLSRDTPPYPDHSPCGRWRPTTHLTLPYLTLPVGRGAV